MVTVTSPRLPPSRSLPFFSAQRQVNNPPRTKTLHAGRGKPCNGPGACRAGLQHTHRRFCSGAAEDANRSPPGLHGNFCLRLQRPRRTSWCCPATPRRAGRGAGLRPGAGQGMRGGGGTAPWGSPARRRPLPGGTKPCALARCAGGWSPPPAPRHRPVRACTRTQAHAPAPLPASTGLLGHEKGFSLGSSLLINTACRPALPH